MGDVLNQIYKLSYLFLLATGNNGQFAHIPSDLDNAEKGENLLSNKYTIFSLRFLRVLSSLDVVYLHCRKTKKCICSSFMVKRCMRVCFIQIDVINN